MGIFKSREEKKIERTIEVRKGVNSLKRNIRDLAKHETSYVTMAKKAKKIGDNDQYKFLKRQLKKTAAQRRLRERQLLSIETAVQIKNQAESDADFARSMGAVANVVFLSQSFVRAVLRVPAGGHAGVRKKPVYRWAVSDFGSDRGNSRLAAWPSAETVKINGYSVS